MGIGHAVFELDGEVAQGAWPVRDGKSSFAADVFQAQVEEFDCPRFAADRFRNPV